MSELPEPRGRLDLPVELVPRVPQVPPVHRASKAFREIRGRPEQLELPARLVLRGPIQRCRDQQVRLDQPVQPERLDQLVR
jgi:hypothetical protein